MIRLQDVYVLFGADARGSVGGLCIPDMDDIQNGLCAYR